MCCQYHNSADTRRSLLTHREPAVWLFSPGFPSQTLSRALLALPCHLSFSSKMPIPASTHGYISWSLLWPYPMAEQTSSIDPCQVTLHPSKLSLKNSWCHRNLNDVSGAGVVRPLAHVLALSRTIPLAAPHPEAVFPIFASHTWAVNASGNKSFILW